MNRLGVQGTTKGKDCIFLPIFFVRLKENAYLCTRFKVESSVGLF